ncbi:hypothetical protein D9C73_003343 [Collichthys lucidus]|uniref:Uncharacterized protein n=1 Tax=Collichthys lucidus TaxID=240159 RepID=A0A4U5U5D5_COLLU|nr:hypothetical protein D9C73_003343 [Collichthys lucidus]
MDWIPSQASSPQLSPAAAASAISKIIHNTSKNVLGRRCPPLSINIFQGSATTPAILLASQKVFSSLIRPLPLLCSACDNLVHQPDSPAIMTPTELNCLQPLTAICSQCFTHRLANSSHSVCIEVSETMFYAIFHLLLPAATASTKDQPSICSCCLNHLTLGPSFTCS